VQNVWLRWLIASLLAIATFAATWVTLHFGFSVASGDALGWTVLPFTVVSGLSGFWASQRIEEPTSPSERHGEVKERPNIVQKQRGGKNSRQLQVGHDLKVTRKDD
jgi:hypothetical protein